MCDNAIDGGISNRYALESDGAQVPTHRSHVTDCVIGDLSTAAKENVEQMRTANGIDGIDRVITDERAVAEINGTQHGAGEENCRNTRVGNSFAALKVQTLKRQTIVIGDFDEGLISDVGEFEVELLQESASMDDRAQSVVGDVERTKMEHP